MYLSTLNDKINDIALAFDTNDFSELKKRTHFLKGSSLSVCATSISQLCMNIEQSISKNELTIEKFQGYLVTLKNQAQKTFQILSEFIGKEKEYMNPF
jgi:HPt (histidine-containing phosphotransfer) domain-containing protein